MVTLFVKHPVQDYGKWKRFYDELGPTRQSMGIVSATVHRDIDDPNLVTVTHQFGSLDTAAAFANSDELKTTMMKAGVVGMPDVWFAEDIESTTF